MADNGPFSEEDFATMKQSLKDLDEAESLAKRAMRAGVESGAELERIRETRNRTLMLLREFFPNR